MKVILVPIADRPECAVALNTAFTWAKGFDALVVGCHIRPHRGSEVSLPQPLITGIIDDTWTPPMDEEDAERMSASARELFSRVAGEHGIQVTGKFDQAPEPRALWQEKVGSPDRVIPIVGPASDLVVVSRPEGGKTAGLARIFMLQALLHSHRPVLILPQEGESSVGRHIVIAWNQSGEAARAVAAAMPLLTRAERVTILSSGPSSGLGPNLKQLSQYLAAHGVVDTDCVNTEGRGKAEDEILEVYRDRQCDLLVMGAYSRSRLRQLIFGGLTEHLLYAADIPVVMLH